MIQLRYENKMILLTYSEPLLDPIILTEESCNHTTSCIYNKSKIYFTIFHQTKFEFPEDIDDVSADAQDLIKQLICVPSQRFGKRGLDEFKAHTWFSGIDWDNIRDSKHIFLSTFFHIHGIIIQL